MLRLSCLLGLCLSLACGDAGNLQPDAGVPVDVSMDEGVGIDAGVDAADDATADTGVYAGADGGMDAGRIACDDPVLGPATDWRHSIISRATAASGSSHHSTQGPVVRVGEAALLPGKFAYGFISKDLQDEDVRAFVRTSTSRCEWAEAGPEVTDSDGRAILMAPALSEPGLYEYVLVVNGDLTTARGVIAVLGDATELVIFDIDGTITTDDGEVFEEVLLNGTAEIMEGAADLTHYYANRGIQPVYMTGRPYILQGRTREWLAAQGLALGPLHTTDSVLSTLPGERTEAYKLDYLSGLLERGFVIAAAYGNADTDVCAYARAGISPMVTYIIGDFAGTACEGFDATQPVETYPDHQRTLP